MKIEADNTTNPELTEIRQSLLVIKNITRKKSDRLTELSDQMRVNEQEMFAAVIHKKLSDVSDKAAGNFRKILRLLARGLHEITPDFFLHGALLAVKTLGNLGLVSKNNLSAAQQIALGRAQLDDNPLRLDTEKSDPQSNGTPLRTIRIALKKYLANIPATPEELKSFLSRFEFKKLLLPENLSALLR